MMMLTLRQVLKPRQPISTPSPPVSFLLQGADPSARQRARQSGLPSMHLGYPSPCWHSAPTAHTCFEGMICATCRGPGHGSDQGSSRKTLRDTEIPPSLDAREKGRTRLLCTAWAFLLHPLVSTARSRPEVLPFPRPVTTGLSPSSSRTCPSLPPPPRQAVP